MDDERRRAVGRRLDAEREHDERRDPPFPQHRADESRSIPTTIGSTTPPATIDPISEASVRDGVRCAASQTLTRSSAAPMPQAGSSTRVTRAPKPIESPAIAARPASIATTKTTAG